MPHRTRVFPLAEHLSYGQSASESWLGLLCALGLCLLSACGPGDAELTSLRAELAAQRAELNQLRGEMNDGLTLALCSPELRQLLEDVQRECTQPGASSGAAAPGVGQCTTKQIRPAVISADPEHRGRFLKLMSHLPHEVVYIAKGGTEVAPYRLDRLHRLVRRALLQSTVFLVVSSPEDGDGESLRRAEMVERMLRERQVDTRKIRRWLYAYPATKQDIDRAADLPGLGESRDLFRGVWVFRADC